MAPIAGICFLFFFAYPLAFAILHLWLWLRHPSGKGRYFVAALAFVVAILVTVGVLCTSLVLEAVTHGGSQAALDISRFSFLTHFFGAAASAGIVPILCRLFTRSKLQFRDETDRDSRASSRGSIADILFLSFFCAVTLVAFRAETGVWRFFDGLFESHTIIVAFGASVAAIASMRLLANASRGSIARSVISAFVVCLFIGIASIEGSNYHTWAWNTNGGVYEIDWESQFRWSTTLIRTCFFASSFPIFALMMKGCGVTLATKKADSRRSRAVESVGNYALGFFAFVFVSAVVGFICFAPSSNMAGIPMTYKIPANGGSRFLGGPLAVNIIVWLLVTLAIYTPAAMLSRLPTRSVIIARIVVGAAFLGTLYYALYFAPNRIAQLSSERAVFLYRSENYDSGIAHVCSKIEAYFLPRSKQVCRNPVDGARIDYADPECLAQVLRLPRLESLYLDGCKLSTSMVEPLRDSEYLTTLSIKDSTLSDGVAKIFADLPNLKSVWCDVEAIQFIGRHRIASQHLPTGRFELWLEIDAGGTIQFPPNLDIGNAYLSRRKSSATELVIQNSEAMISLKLELHNSSIKTCFRNMPSLKRLEFRGWRKIDVKIQNLPSLIEIQDGTNVANREKYQQEKYGSSCVAGLAIQDAPKLKSILLDIAECQTFRLPAHDTNTLPYELTLDGRTTGTSGAVGRKSGSSLAQLLNGIESGARVNKLTIYGAEIDSEVIAELSRLQVSSLYARDCKCAGDMFKRVKASISLKSIALDTFRPNDQQFEEFISAVPKIKRVGLDGSLLTKIPESFAPKNGIVVLYNANQLQSLLDKLIANTHVERPPIPWPIVGFDGTDFDGDGGLKADGRERDERRE